MQSASASSRIVGTWRILELFRPTSVDKETRGRCEAPTTRWSPGERLPWDPDHYCQHWLKPGHCWEHSVYLGHFELEGMYDALHRVFPPVSTAYDERCDGESAMLRLTVNHEGVAEPHGLVLSTCAWGLGELARNRRTFDLSQAAFEDTQALIKRNLEQYFLDALAKYDAPMLDEATVLGANAGVQMLLGLDRSPGLKLSPALISSRQIPLKKDKPATETHKPDDSRFLNSFLIDDLDVVFKDLRRRGVKGPLGVYLGDAVDACDKVDVRSRTHDELLELLSPDRMPLGRWPSNPKHPLATSQQLAVNLALQNQKEGRPLFSINGPPGTGKTTLLRDLVAALVTQRAQAIAKLKRPEDGFTRRVFDWMSGDYPRRVYELVPSLQGYEILIASSNNAAVENISHELPDVESLSGDFEDAQYFAEFATSLLKSSKKDNPQGWGMISARLGNKDNCSKFARDFWYRRNYDDPSLPANMQEWLQRFSRERRRVSRSWQEAVQRFRHSEARVIALLDKARDAKLQLREQGRRSALEFEKVQLQDELSFKRDKYREHCDGLQGLVHRLQSSEKALEAANEACREHQARKPRLIESLWTFGKSHRVWFEQSLELQKQQKTAKEALASARNAHELGNSAMLSAKAQLAAIEAREAKLSQEIIALECSVEHLRERWGKALPDARWFEDDFSREIVAPWLSPQLCQARSELFLAALDLHVDFLEHNAGKMERNLRAAVDVIQRTAPAQLDEKMRLAAWQSLFFVVPTVSTTFASAGRMLSGLGAQCLGWLLVDEAGQASPQSVVGAMWRSKMAVVVGDPIQLTPVVTLPAKAQGEICDALACPSWARPRTASVQSIADARNPWGTALSDGDGDQRWVGAPLLVHRRCLDPMFSICNAIAYDDAMLHGCEGRAKRYPHLPESTWIDIKAHAFGETHALRADAQFCAQLLEALFEIHGVERRDVIVISPFRDMANAVRVSMPRKAQRCGSVHTAQGQEAPIVVLVLGGNPTRAGARLWATSTPNLINVAVSRAKDQLYVVGDWEGWSGLRYVDRIALAMTPTSASRFLAKVQRGARSVSPVPLVQLDESSSSSRA